LLDLGATVTAVEKDPVFAKHLNRFQTADKRLTVHSADFLTFPIVGSSYKAISNIPFKITAPILEKLCTHSDQFHSFTVIVQKEVADRIKAKPKCKQFGSLTLFLEFYTEYKSSFHISPSSYFPRPNVDTTALHLNCHPPPDKIDSEMLFFMIRIAFRQRRKMLTTSLKAQFPHLRKCLKELGLSEKARPEELNLDEWIKLFHRNNL
jgi:16S rRNA (adenine1518-N6/adenine1519-N6)-dimethyltransferase